MLTFLLLLVIVALAWGAVAVSKLLWLAVLVAVAAMVWNFVTGRGPRI